MQTSHLEKGGPKLIHVRWNALSFVLLDPFPFLAYILLEVTRKELLEKLGFEVFPTSWFLPLQDFGEPPIARHALQIHACMPKLWLFSEAFFRKGNIKLPYEGKGSISVPPAIEGFKLYVLVTRLESSLSAGWTLSLFQCTWHFLNNRNTFCPYLCLNLMWVNNLRDVSVKVTLDGSTRTKCVHLMDLREPSVCLRVCASMWSQTLAWTRGPFTVLA